MSNLVENNMNKGLLPAKCKAQSYLSNKNNINNNNNINK